MSFLQDNKNKKKLSFYNFSKDIPKDLGKSIKLEELEFDNAPEIPKSIGKLPQLKFLKIKSKTLVVFISPSLPFSFKLSSLFSFPLTSYGR